MWLQLMVLALLCNGIGDFGLRVLQELGFARDFTPHYLAGWYAAGGLGAMVAAWRSGLRPSRADWAIGLGLGLCSVVGQTMLGRALAQGVPGAIAYPAAKTGGVFLVATVGVLAFRERPGPLGFVALLVGLAGVLLLSLE